MLLTQVPLLNNRWQNYLRRPQLSSCVLYLPFLDNNNPNPKDYSGSNNDGTITGAVWTKLPGELWALSFDGSDDYVSLGAPASLDIALGDVSVETWLYMEAQTEDYAAIFDKGGTGIGTAGYALDAPSTPNIEKRRFSISDGGGVAGDLETSPLTVALNDGKWHHLVGYADRTNALIGIYLDGAHVGATAIPGTIGSLSNPARIAYIGGVAATRSYKGKISLFRIYTATLSATEVANHYRMERGMFRV